MNVSHPDEKAPGEASWTSDCGEAEEETEKEEAQKLAARQMKLFEGE